MDADRALGTIALLSSTNPCGRPQHHAEPSANDSGPRNVVCQIERTGATPENMFMLASLVLDLWRRLELVYLATRTAALSADPEAAALLLVHNRRLEATEQGSEIDWHARAVEAHKMVHHLLDRVQEEHDMLLESVATADPAAFERIRAGQDEALGEIGRMPTPCA